MDNLELNKPITFDELIKHGIEHGTNIVDGMPWSWSINGKAVTHENNQCYIIETIHGFKKFTPTDKLIAFDFGLDIWPRLFMYGTNNPNGCSL